MKQSSRVAEFPRGGIAIAVMLGVPAFVFAAIFTALAVDYSIGSYRVLPFGNRVTDVAVAAALAVAFGTIGVVSASRLRTEVRIWRKLEVPRDHVSGDRVPSLILATVIVAVAMVGATWLQDYRQFPWIVFMTAIFPAELIVVDAAGGPHEASGESYVSVGTFFLATMMWYGLIEAVRRWWPRRTKPDQSSNA
jgi:hypothetical protein